MIGMDVKGARWEVKVAGREWNGQKREEFGRKEKNLAEGNERVVAFQNSRLDLLMTLHSTRRRRYI